MSEVQDAQTVANAAMVIASAARLNARTHAMVSGNMQAALRGETLPYPEEAFDRAVDEEECNYNQVLINLGRGL